MTDWFSHGSSSQYSYHQYRTYILWVISNLTTTNMFNPWSTLTDSIEFCDFLQDGHGCLIDGNRLWLTALTSSLFLLSVKLEIRTSVIVHWCVFFRPMHILFDSPLCYHPLTGIIVSFPVEKLILHTHWLPFFSGGLSKRIRPLLPSILSHWRSDFTTRWSFVVGSKKVVYATVLGCNSCWAFLGYGITVSNLPCFRLYPDFFLVCVIV